MNRIRSLTCQNPTCDRKDAVVIAYGPTDDTCPGIAKTETGAAVECGGALLTDGEWEEIREVLNMMNQRRGS